MFKIQVGELINIKTFAALLLISSKGFITTRGFLSGNGVQASHFRKSRKKLMDIVLFFF